MAATKTDLTWTDNFAAANKPVITNIQTAFNSVQTWANALKENMEAMAKDSFPSGYTWDEDGLAQFTTHNNYDKQTAVDSYAGGDKTLSGTGSWTDVDATNVALVFTPDTYAGDFRVHFQFCVECVSSNATNEADLRFRLTDSSTNSTFIAKVHQVTGVTGTTHTIPVNLSYTFDSLAASSQTIKLQYYITTTTAMTIKVLANSNFPISMESEKV